MKISNPRVIPNNISAYPFQLVVDVDGATTMIMLYEVDPPKWAWVEHYSMWKAGFQFAASVMFTVTWADNGALG